MMTGQGAVSESPGYGRWVSWRAMRLHLALLIVLPGCVAAGWFEFTRAVAGNTLSWVYVFEWPFFGAFAVYLWWRTLHEKDRDRRAAAPAAEMAGDTASSGPGPWLASEPAADPQLQAWNEYLARLHATEPAGGPPGER